MRRLILFLAAFALAWPACADPARGRIRSVQVDERLGLLALEVDGFTTEGAFEMRLDDRPEALAIVNRVPGRIVARLPGGLGWARYVVRLVRTANPGDAEEAEFFFGVVGPATSEH